MTERRCPECARGQHPQCSGELRGGFTTTCTCRWCKAWLNEHGSFSVPGNEPEPAT